jgi:hypothetical protein
MYLTREQRRQLESVVGAARTVAEDGARAELRRLYVHEREPAAYLTAEDRELRIRLRARAKQLGDAKDHSLEHGFEREVHACAYEQWHRMLFARFLAERGLLMHPTGVAVSLQDCAELAPDEGAADAWELAGRYAAAMLPQIFRPDDSLLAVRLADESRQKLEQLLARLDAAVFQGKDAIGWVYQFWQAQKKDAINASEVKIGADELPAVTQLFTEPYMVGFLLHNSLGAWWAGKVLAANPHLALEAKAEQELREACAIPGVEWTYLRFVKEAERWRPAAGTFDGWPKLAGELKVLDPCCGSGHFLVGMLEILTALRAAEEGLGPAEASDAVLRDNLHGLEIDPRCTELAAFAVALAAWSVPGAEGVRNLPELKIACSGLSLGVTAREWRALAADRPDLLGEMDQLYLDFEKATVLGSLIQPRKAMGSLFEAQSHRLLDWLKERAIAERSRLDVLDRELAVTAHGAATAAELLSGQYQLVATNVPYLGRSKQTETLRAFCDANHSTARADLATCFVERCVQFCTSGGTQVLVTPHSWLFLSSYKQFRLRLLKEEEWSFVARLGEHGFESPQAAGAFVALSIISRHKPRTKHSFAGIDVSDARVPADKATQLVTKDVQLSSQIAQCENPDAVVTFNSTVSNYKRLSTYADAVQGASMVDLERFRLMFWEVASSGEGWVLHQSSPTGDSQYSGMCFVSANHATRVDIHEAASALKEEGRLGGYRSGHKNVGRKGVLVAWLRTLPASLFEGTIYDHNTTAIIPKHDAYLSAIWCLCSSPVYNTFVRELNQKLQVNTATLTSISFDLAYWTRIAAEKYPNGLPKPYSSDPTQWLFNGHPVGSDAPLQVAVARLCNYRWPRQTGSSFPDCPALEADGLEGLADDDGIVCLPSVLGERPAADRLLELLVTAYGDDWNHGTLQQLLEAAGYGNRDLAAWLRDAFFEQHCKLFQHRPFLWHICDGEQDGFSALVNYHSLDRKNLERLTWTYLGDWMQRQEQAVRENRDGAVDRLAAAKVLQGELEKILEGESPYDIFVRWKSLAKQPIGWEPDLDDGVRLNIRPFLSVKDVGKKGAGILRWKPNVHWNKDRGKDVESAPWFGTFGGERINDHHLSLAEKRAAQGGRP